MGVTVGSCGIGVGECTAVNDGGGTNGISVTDGACINIFDGVFGDSNAGGADPGTVPDCVVEEQQGSRNETVTGKGGYVTQTGYSIDCCSKIICDIQLRKILRSSQKPALEK